MVKIQILLILLPFKKSKNHKSLSDSIFLAVLPCAQDLRVSISDRSASNSDWFLVDTLRISKDLEIVVAMRKFLFGVKWICLNHGAIINL